MGPFEKAQMFKRVVEMGSMVSVAKALNISPSAVSKRLAELEASLGVQLLKRTTRSLAVTEAGEHFYREVRHISSQWQALMDETVSLGESPGGSLTVAAPAPVLSRVLMPMLPGFNARYPGIKLVLQSVDYDSLPLRSADISLARHIDKFDSGTFVGVALCDYHNSLFASPEYIARNDMPETLEQLNMHTCLCYGKESKPSVWQFSSGESVEVNGTLVSDNTEVIVEAGVQGGGIIYIPEMIVQRELDSGRLIPILSQATSQQLSMWGYYQKLSYLPVKVRAFIDFFRQCW